MFCFEHQFKVTECIVCGVAILVVNDLVRSQHPSKELFHDQAMFHHISLAISFGVLWYATSAIGPVLPVPDQGSVPCLSSLAIDAAFKGAVLLPSLAGLTDVGTTESASVLRGCTPAMPEIARVRAKGARLFAAILRMKQSSALAARQGYGESFHTLIVTPDESYCNIEERYCEIAARRLEQGVLF